MAPTIELTDIVKTFGGARALNGVSLTVESGEVHGLLGENGSGKSTLIKVLAGVHTPDSGQLRVGGNPVDLPLQAGQTHQLGIEFVHQDLGLIRSLTVVENLWISDLAGEMNRWYVSWRAKRAQAAELFEEYGLSLDPAALVADVDPVQRALLAIVRAVHSLRRTLARTGSDHQGLLVLDEPTVFLPNEGVEQVFALVREIVSRGSSVLFVSHDIDEVRAVTDRVTILRDGTNAGTVTTAEVSAEQIVDLILGRQLRREPREARHIDTSTARITVRGVTSGRFGPVDLDVYPGETVGVTGLVGSGFEELPYAMFGARPEATGTMTVDGVTHQLRRLTPVEAIDAGLALVPADRLQDASVPDLSITDNVTLEVLDDFATLGYLSRRRAAARAHEYVTAFDVRPADPRLEMWQLSGGNQQKVVLAKWLATNPGVLLLHEPTQGVDIGSRQQILGFVKEANDRGTAVICASSDYEQLSMMCDRVLVFRHGLVAAELAGPVAKEEIIEMCYQTARSA